MNWILAFNRDFSNPEPMTRQEAEKLAQELASKSSRQFTKGKTAYRELNEALSKSYSEAVDALVNPAAQSADAQKIIYGIISEEIGVYGESVPEDQIPLIKKAVIDKVKKDYSLPVYKILDSGDKEEDEKRISQIIAFGIEASGAHVAGEDERNGYSESAALEKYNALQDAFSAADKKYSQINKSLGKLESDNLYVLIGGGNESEARKLSTSSLNAKLNGLQGEFESGAEIQNLKHLAGNVFSSDDERKDYDGYLEVREKKAILDKLEARSSGGSINSKLFMEAATQLDKMSSSTNDALMLLYGFADAKSLDTGTDYLMMESVLDMMKDKPAGGSGGDGGKSDRGSAQGSTTSAGNDYTVDDFYEAYQKAKEEARKHQEKAKRKSSVYEPPKPEASASQPTGQRESFRPEAAQTGSVFDQNGARAHSSASDTSTGVPKKKMGCLKKALILFVAFFLLCGVMGTVLAQCASYGYGSSESSTKGEPKSVAVNSDYRGPIFPAQLAEGDLYGYVGTDGNWAIEPMFSEACVFSDGLALVQDSSSGRYGYIDSSGEFAIAPKFAEAGEFHDGLAWVRLDKHDENFGNYAYIDKDGNEVLSGGIVGLTDFSDDGSAWICVRDSSSKHTTVLLDQDGVGAELEGQVDIRTPHEGMSAFRGSNGFGFMDSTGKVAIQPGFGSVGDYSEGLAAASPSKGSASFNYIDKAGKTVIAGQFKIAGCFSGGVAPVMTKDNEWLYIDESGDVAIDGGFKYCDVFNGDYAAAKGSSGKYGIIDKSGNWVVDPLFSFLSSSSIVLETGEDPIPMLSSVGM